MATFRFEDGLNYLKNRQMSVHFMKILFREHKHSLRGAVGKVGVADPARAQTCNP